MTTNVGGSLPFLPLICLVLLGFVSQTTGILYDAEEYPGYDFELLQEIEGADEEVLYGERMQVARRLQEEGMPELSSKWDIGIPDMFYCDSGEFLFRFDLSDFIENDMMEFSLSRGEECEYDIWDNLYLVPYVEYDQAPKGDGTLVRQVALVLQPDLSLIGASPIYTVSEDSLSGTLAFCAILTIKTEDLETVVNFRKVLYEQTTTLISTVRRLNAKTNEQIDFFETQSHRHLMQDCSAGFDVVFENWWDGASAMSVDPIENITYVDGENSTGIVIAPNTMLELGGSGNPLNASFAFNLDVFECDGSNQVIVKQVAYNQGDRFRICIKPDADAAADGMYMRRLDNLYYVRSDIPGMIQYAVEGGLPDFYGMSEFSCERGSEVCWVDTIVRAESIPGMVNVIGIASLQFGSSSSRALNDEERMLQFGTPEDRGKFSLLFPVSTFAQELVKREETSSTSFFQTLLLIILSFVFVVVLIFLFWIRLYRKAHSDEEEDGLVRRKSDKKKKKKGKSSDRSDKTSESSRKSKHSHNDSDDNDSDGGDGDGDYDHDDPEVSQGSHDHDA